MSKKNNLLLSFLIIILLGGIYFFALNNKKIKSSTESNVETVVVQEKKIENKNDFYDIAVTYPVEKMDIKNVIEQFVSYKVNEKKEEWKVGGKAYTEEKAIELRQGRESADSDFPDRPKMVYQYYMMYKKYESKKLGTISYVITTYEFTGGANGNTTINTFTFNKDGQVAIDSILDFNNDKDIELSKVLADVMIKRDGEQAAKDMIYDGLGISYLKADGKTLDKEKCHCDGFFFGSNFQNFVVEDGGIRFIFNKYQIAPGSSGTPEIILNWSILKSFILSSFKI